MIITMKGDSRKWVSIMIFKKAKGTLGEKLFSIKVVDLRKLEDWFGRQLYGLSGQNHSF